jgi:hypothetical protein
MRVIVRLGVPAGLSSSATVETHSRRLLLDKPAVAPSAKKSILGGPHFVRPTLRFGTNLHVSEQRVACTSCIRRIVVVVLAFAAMNAIAGMCAAQFSLPGFGERGDPVDPFQSRPGMAAPATPGTPTQPIPSERVANPRDNYVTQANYGEPANNPNRAAQRDYPAERREYAPSGQPQYPDTAQSTPGNSPPSDNRPPPDHPFGGQQDPLFATKPVARVGPEVILVADVLGPVNQQLASRLREGVIQEHEVPREQEKLLRVAINNLIDQKLVVTVARRELPAEALPKIEQSMNEQFDKTQLKSLYEQAKVSTQRELDEMLKQSGSSLARQRKMYFERSMMQEWVRREVNFDAEVTHDEMLAYYRDHADEFSIKAQARWEEMMVRFEEFTTKAEAWHAVAAMGNRVWNRQAPFAQVAREQSQGATASEGGVRDWTTRGSHASAEIDAALFTLPVGQLSKIIEGPTGLHIVRVIERQEDSKRPFVEAQVEIREKIKKQKADGEVKEYLIRLRADIPVWTIFDGPPEELAEAGAAGGPIR